MVKIEDRVKLTDSTKTTDPGNRCEITNDTIVDKEIENKNLCEKYADVYRKASIEGIVISSLVNEPENCREKAANKCSNVLKFMKTSE